MSRHPFFSIVIPTYGRSAQLIKCLESLAALEYPRESFEVLVVNDGGEFSQEALGDGFRDRLDLTLLNQSHAGPATARNFGASKAKGEYLAFTDDDCLPYPNWLQTLAARFQKVPGCIIGGRTVNGSFKNLYSSASQLLIDYLYSYYNSRNGHAHFITSNNLAIPLNVFFEQGGFDQTFPIAAAEDRELCDRLSHNGYPIHFAPEVLVCHEHVLSLRSFWRQHFNYGAGAHRFHAIRAERKEEPVKVEPFQFYIDLVSFPFTAKTPRKFSIAALLFISQVANAMGYFWQKKK
jgi:GT2 family glycosyltransferase